ncbi:putative arginine/serine-rich splicing factor [Hibiscus syriacus]|uniref:Arginine/serine-rich splicing factor n=1 Tax=Hibiscus syriacus TaxID=106335 RepID=A0A6A2X196_HIBSY|nr:putative arginine/serine-rich splicing factor [Hibiscus syriacus]
MNFHLHHHSFATVGARFATCNSRGVGIRNFRVDDFSPVSRPGYYGNFPLLDMEAIKKQATKLREQVAKQQQAVLRHLGHFSNEDITVDEAELQYHQKLQDLYISTKAAKHLQRNIVRGIEGFIATSTKLIEIARKLADDCCKYGDENQSSGSPLARAALYFGKSHKSMEDEREALLGILGERVSEPLRELIIGAPLEDARHLTHRYDRFRQEVEDQLKHAEERLNELKSSMMALGREATAAMLLAEDQQQKITLQVLRAMGKIETINYGRSSSKGISFCGCITRALSLVLTRIVLQVDAEKSYHQHILAILEKLYAEMTLEEQKNESLNSVTSEREVNVSIADDNFSSNRSEAQGNKQSDVYFIAKVVHPFDAEADGELSLAVGDYVVVRQVGPSGWSEGECKGKAGWFPSAYVERQEKAQPAS